MKKSWGAWLGFALPVAVAAAALQCSGADAIDLTGDDGGVDGTTDSGGTDGLFDTTKDVSADSSDAHLDGDATSDAPNGDGGCTGPADCPKGQACDPSTQQCSSSCSGGLVCNGGCCDGAKCAGGVRQDRCGNDGAACVACGGLTPTCDMGTCTSACGGPDGGAACGAGYCCNAGQCAASGNTTCGSGGACVDCTMSPDGLACLATFVCGCAQPSDCPANQACKKNKCGTACDPASACNGGCCSGGSCAAGNQNAVCGSDGLACAPCSGSTPTCTSGQCTAACGSPNDGTCSGGYCCSGTTCTLGNQQDACGTSATCVDCLLSTTGHQCVGPGICGCAVATDCPVDTACNLLTHQCAAQCGGAGMTGCNGGCCAASGKCQPGTSNAACGSSGACVDCTTTCNPGPTCLGGTHCGCTSTAECANDLSCGRIICDTDAGACTP